MKAVEIKLVSSYSKLPKAVKQKGSRGLQEIMVRTSYLAKAVFFKM